MTEGPERVATGLRRGASDSDALTDLDLRDRDWRALIEQLPIAVYIDRLDEWSTNVYTSPQIEAILGYTAEEWAGENHLLLKILHPDDRDRVIAAHLRSCETGEPFRMEYRMIARDGRVVWFLDQATVVPGEPGHPGFHHGFLLDISQRKELEAALAERTEALGRKIDDLVATSAELRVEAVAVSRDALADGRVHALTRRTHKDGSLIEVELLAAPVIVRGEPVGTYAIYHDVRELQRRKQYLESLLELSPTAIVTIDLDDNVTSWNSAAESLFGYSDREAIGRNIDDLVARSDGMRAEAVDANRRAGKGNAVRLTTQRTRKDGTLVDVDVRAAPIFVGGQHVGMYALYHDI